MNNLKKRQKRSNNEKKRRGQIFEEEKKLQKGICLNDAKKYSFPQRSIYLEWTAIRGDNGKECTTTERKTE